MIFPTPKLRIAIVGAGALGTEVMLRLLREPVLRALLAAVVIIDPDILDKRNIAVSRLYQEVVHEHGQDLVDKGEQKAILAATFLRSRTSWNVVSHGCAIGDLGWDVLRQVDILISCTDNALARVEATYAARALGLPMLDGGVLGGAAAGGRVTWFSGERGAACYLCGLPEQRRADLLAFAAALSLNCQAPEDIAMGESAAVSSSLQQTAATLAETLLHFVHAKTSPESDRFAASWASRLHQQNKAWLREEITLARSSTCPWHETKPQLVSVALDQTFREVLDTAAGSRKSRLQLAWPICLSAICRSCGALDDRPRRVAVVRREGVCSQCHAAHHLAPLRAVDSVGHNDPVAEMTPRQLGLLHRQLLQLRPALTPGKREVSTL